MKRSKMFLYTKKEVPTEAELTSHKLMLRAGMIRKVAAGIYDLLPLGLMVLRNVEKIVREELCKADAQEVLLPSIQPSELWKESGRWDKYGKELLRIKDRHNRDFCYGPTHEEVITDLIRRDVRSYRQLPVNLFQIQTKFRDEIRPRFGVMRSREFIMKDGYSFDANDDGAEKTYKMMYSAYTNIFKRCGLKFRSVEADTGQIGGSFSHEFMVLAQSGEDSIVSCDKCDYAANIEKAKTRHEEDRSDSMIRQEDMISIETPGKKSVCEIADFLNVDSKKIVKTLIYETENGIVAVLLRGDHSLSETKLKSFLGCDTAVMASDKTVEKVTGSPTGFAGPVGLDMDIIADNSVKGIKNFIVGANQADTHLTNVNLERDFNVSRFGDIRNVESGDSCPLCDGKLKVDRGIEVGHIFKLGTKYSESMKALFNDVDGEERPMVMGCYGIGIGRTVAAAIEQNNDENGIIWPMSLAPFKVTVLPLNIKDDKSMEVANTIYKGLINTGIETLYDDRDERAGLKFKDADLIGIPLQVIIGTKNLKDGNIEIKYRNSGERKIIPVDQVVCEIQKIVVA